MKQKTKFQNSQNFILFKLKQISNLFYMLILNAVFGGPFILYHPNTAQNQIFSINYLDNVIQVIINVFPKFSQELTKKPALKSNSENFSMDEMAKQKPRKK